MAKKAAKKKTAGKSKAAPKGSVRTTKTAKGKPVAARPGVKSVAKKARGAKASAVKSSAVKSRASTGSAKKAGTGVRGAGASRGRAGKKAASAKSLPRKNRAAGVNAVPQDMGELEAQAREALMAYEADEQGALALTEPAADEGDAVTEEDDALALSEPGDTDAEMLAAATRPREASGVVRPHDLNAARAFAIAAARMCRDDKCEDVLVLDVTKIRQDVDFIVIASGTSDRQMRSVLQHLEEAGAKMNSPAVRTSKDDRATWLLADFVDVVVHLFEPNTRAHYNLEMHFADAPKVEWERPDQTPRDRAGLMNNRRN